HESILAPIGGLPTVFSVLGPDNGAFLFHADLRRLGALLEQVGSGRVALEMVEVHSLDRLQHWNLDQPERIRYYYRQTDDFVRELHQKCERNGVMFVLLSDHGMEPVSGYIDLMSGMQRLGVPASEFSYFIENTRATFWFHSDRARSTIGDWLASQRGGALLTYADMRQYGVDFRDASYGDVYFLPDAGKTLFPNDFCHPVANRVLAYRDWQQRARMTNARHRGDHGYRPDSESELGLLLVAGDGRGARAEDITLLDFAPSMLDLLGRSVPSSMRGISLFSAA
ncbi:MAG TPA: alkaline phosphatase family protein, partial [Gemmatimonadaceae bacterium]|nr:alkaline phosphatase family protein [Gemmatimonadaceae bacterium]